MAHPGIGIIPFGAPGDIPLMAPYRYCPLPGTSALSIASDSAGDHVISNGGYDIGGTAFALSSNSSTIPSMLSAAPATTTPAPAATTPTVKPAPGRRPNQGMHHKAHLHDLAINALHNGHRNRHDREG